MLEVLQSLKEGTKMQLQCGEHVYMECRFEKVVPDYNGRGEAFDVLYSKRIIKKTNAAGQPTGRYAERPVRVLVSRINSIELPDETVDVAEDGNAIEKSNIIIVGEQMPN